MSDKPFQSEEVDGSYLEALELLSARDGARTEKDWKEADNIRDELFEMGYKIKDTPDGSKLIKII
jgi:cysteinyl-tRNA synthetase